MKISLIAIGKTLDENINNLFNDYSQRLKHYVDFEWIVIPDIKNSKNMSAPVQKEKEGELILKQLTAADDVFLFDEKGKEFSSVEFADFINKKMLYGTKRLVFVIGGPYGFSNKVYERANGKVSLSRMTFSHQMVRIIIAEQIYRAYTILKGEPYHHE